MTASNAARSTSGRSANSQRPAPSSALIARLDGPEQPHPSELGKLALMRVKHEVARVAERRLENRPLTLTEHDRVGSLAGRDGGARAVHVEEHAVEVETVDQVELGQIDQID